MIEDDTIRILKRIPFLEMMELYRSKDKPLKGRSWDDWFHEYNWTWEEFKHHWKDWNNGSGTYSDYELSKMK